MARVNIKDVARLAGVSTATVSHVMNRTRFVREETRRRVLEAIAALDYLPGPLVRSLAIDAGRTVGVVIADITNPFFTAVAHGLEETFGRNGYHTVFCVTEEDPAREEAYLRLLVTRRLDGLLIAPTGVYSELLARLVAANLPVLLLDRSAPGLPAPVVGVDNEGGAYQATRYLVELGHRRIAILVGLETISTHQDRFYGYQRALLESGLGLEKALVVRAAPGVAGPDLHRQAARPAGFFINHQMTPPTYEALKRLLDRPDRPSAIFVTNSEMTVGVLHALKEHRLRCPEDVSLVSFDDHAWAPIFSPPLTAIRQPTYQLGRTAAGLLLKLIAGQEIEPPPPLPVELIIRESCGRFRPGLQFQTPDKSSPPGG